MNALNTGIVYTALLLSIFSSDVYSNGGDIRYAYPDQIIIVSKLDENDKFDNPVNNVLDEIFKRAELNWEKYKYPANRMFNQLEEGKDNFSVLVNSKRLENCCIVSDTPMVSSELRIYRKSHVPPITDVKDLTGKELITILGFSYGPFKEFFGNPHNGIKYHPTSTHTSAFAMLDQGRADYLLDYDHPSATVLKKYPIDDIQYETIDTIELYLVLHKSYPNAEETMKKLETIMKSIDVDGILSLPSDV